MQSEYDMVFAIYNVSKVYMLCRGVLLKLLHWPGVLFHLVGKK